MSSFGWLPNVNKLSRVCVSGTLRLVWAIITNISKDFTWDGFHVWLWASLEVDLGIICASFPPLKPLIVQIIPSCDFGDEKGPQYGDSSGPRKFIPRMMRGKRVTMRLSAIQSGQTNVQSFWVTEMASPSEVRIMTNKRQEKDLEKAAGDRTLSTQKTQGSSEGEIEIVPREGIKKTVEFHLVESK